MQELSNAIQIAHQLLLKQLHNGGIFVDATMGNGYDTYFMVKNAKVGSYIYAFDIQIEAINSTRKYLDLMLSSNLKNSVKLIHDSHCFIKKYINQTVDAAIFNLGYLPNGSKAITTKANTTITALKECINMLSKNGVLAVVLYPGHPNGLEEYKEIEKYVISLPKKYFTVGWYKMINHHNNAPALCWIEKVGDPV